MPKPLHRLMSRLFMTPLMIHPQKAQIIAAAVTPRLLGETPAPEPSAAMMTEPAPDEDDRLFRVVDGVAILDIESTLVKESSWVDAESGLQSYGAIIEAAEDAATDPEIGGTLLNFDSPGGEVAGLFEAMAALKQIFNAAGKPVYAVANDAAYSAAYGLASTADRIYVTQSGGVASVGAIAIHMERSKANERMGLTFHIFRSGQHKAEINSIEPLSKHAIEKMDTEINRLGSMFVDLVAPNRGLSVETVAAQNGDVYFGPDAVAQGMADQVGTFEDALAALHSTIQTHTPSSSLNLLRGAAAHQPTEAIMPKETPAAEPVATDNPVTAEPAVLVKGATFEQGFDAGMNHAKSVLDLCAKAGESKRAGAFLDDRLTMAQVRAALLSDDLPPEGTEVPIHTQIQGNETVKPEGEAELLDINAFSIYNKMNGGK